MNNQRLLLGITRSLWMKNAPLIILIGFLLCSCANDFEKIKKFTNIENLPAVSAEGYEMLSSDSTIIRFKLQTPEMIVHDDEKVPYTEFPQGVAITQYDGRMNITSFITSRYAKYFTADDRWEAKNNVIAVNQKGDTLKTEYLVWDQKKGKIYSDQFVQIIQKDQITSGTSFESNQDFSEYTFKNLKGQMYIEVQDK
ncbi:MAG TPA: LPS export ABC transporter periplasmic protein LptC [Prolixibacteraceae bacterium]|nr:LPS export ABC transporter periplasmic protein LptC [Prolixibacteraceae bacterium]